MNAMEANWSLYSHIIYDSDNEKRFASELDINDKVAVCTKLPSSFFISTPVVKYNPDWAIAFNEGSVKHIYFIAETKGNTDSLELRGVELAKIECAKAHFAAISNESVMYDVVDSFEKLMNLVSSYLTALFSEGVKALCQQSGVRTAEALPLLQEYNGSAAGAETLVLLKGRQPKLRCD